MYYLLETNYFVKPTAYRTSSLVKEFGFKPSDWLTGALMEKPEEPIRVEFWANGGGGWGEILLDSIPLFSKRLAASLKDAGVDNLQLYPVEIVERNGRAIEEEYWAVNILGLIQCADLSKSDYTDITRTGLYAVNFRKLIIDDAKAGDLHIFRLAESVSSIIVHHEIKEHLDKQGFKYLSFRPLFE